MTETKIVHRYLPIILIILWKSKRRDDLYTRKRVKEFESYSYVESSHRCFLPVPPRTTYLHWLNVILNPRVDSWRLHPDQRESGVQEFRQSEVTIVVLKPWQYLYYALALSCSVGFKSAAGVIYPEGHNSMPESSATLWWVQLKTQTHSHKSIIWYCLSFWNSETQFSIFGVLWIAHGMWTTCFNNKNNGSAVILLVIGASVKPRGCSCVVGESAIESLA